MDSNFSPIITRGNSCASAFEFESRTSSSYRLNVYYHNIVIILTYLFTYKAIRVMIDKTMFSKTTRNLFFYCMSYYLFHGIYFAGTLNWSLYRSITNSKDNCQIMFKGGECHSLYIIGIFLRILLLNSQCAITIERLIVTLFPFSNLINSGTLNIMAFLISVITTSLIRPAAPSIYNSFNCYQQVYPGMRTMIDLLFIMIFFNLFCFPTNCLITMKNRRKFLDFKNAIEYDLKSRYKNKNDMHAAMVVSFISLVQTVFYTFYVVGTYIDLKIYTTPDGLFYGYQYALWIYSFPLAGLALPCSILLSLTGLTKKKINKIAVIQTKTFDQDAYFRSLANQWNAPAPRKSIT